MFPVSPALQADSFTSVAPGNPNSTIITVIGKQLLGREQRCCGTEESPTEEKQATSML